MNGLAAKTNYTLTENGSIAHKSTLNAILDMFASAGAYRSRSDEDCILLFKKAYAEDPELALKCLFWVRDCRGGAAERRFFRVCLKWLAKQDKDAVVRNFSYIVELGRFDDFYCLVNTPAETAMFEYLKRIVAEDIEIVNSFKNENVAISLVGKWLKSCNSSSKETCRLGKKTAKAFGLTERQYRKMLSALRSRINIVEKLMSENKWNDIDFSKVPSLAGLRYRNAFQKHLPEKYEEFVMSDDTKFKATVTAPYEVVNAALDYIDVHYAWNGNEIAGNEVARAAINKYWDNLKDWFDEQPLNALCVIDTSGSMCSCANSSTQPINVAISLGMYAAEKAKGPFAGKYVSFASRPQLIDVDGVDFVDKVNRIYRKNLVDNTNIEATMELLLQTAIKNNCTQEEIPEKLVIISDMEFDAMRYGYSSNVNTNTLFENISKHWEANGYKMPKVVFWNVDCRQQNVPAIGEGISYVSGFSSAIFKCIMSNKDGYDLMIETLTQERYKNIK